MENYLTLDEAARYLNVTEDTIKRYIDRGELPFYKLDRALRFRKEDIDKLVNKQFEVLLSPGLRAAISHSCQIKQGVEAWRIIIIFYNTSQKSRLVVPFGLNIKVTEYKIFVTGEYLEDVEKLPSSMYGAEKFALKYIRKRFESTKDENGDRDIERILENEIFCIEGKCSSKPDPRFFDLSAK